MQDAGINAIILKFLRDRARSTATLDEILDHLSSMSGFGQRVDYDLSSAATLQSSVDASTDRDLLRRLVFTRVEHLERIGLVTIQRRSRLPGFIVGNQDVQVMLCDNFIDIQKAIGFSLTESATRDGRSLKVTPVFERPHYVQNDVFVIMPFKAEMKGVYDVICSCSKKFNLSVRRADDIFGTSRIIQDIWSSIFSAKVIICDCTYKNPNVFYELGIAHTLGKSVILITQDENDVPFDLRNWRYLRYGSDMDALAQQISASLEAALPRKKKSRTGP